MRRTIDEKFAGAATERYTAHLSFGTGSVEQRFHTEGLFQRFEPGCRCNRLRKFTDQPTAGVLSRKGSKPVEMFEPEALRDFEIYAPACIVEVRVSRINGNVMLHSQADAALHLRAIAHTFHPAE